MESRYKDETYSVGDDVSAETSDGKGGIKTGGKGDAPNSSACWFSGMGIL